MQVEPRPTQSPQVALNWPTPEVEKAIRATPAEVGSDHLGRLAAEVDPSVRAVLIMQLACCPASDSKVAEAIVLASLEDKDLLVRRTAAHAIGFLEPRDHLKRRLVKEFERGLSLLSRLDPGTVPAPSLRSSCSQSSSGVVPGSGGGVV